jgi:3-deoxy-7-phosphoheptulonate synthase
VGFKNATSGDTQAAVEAVLSAAQPHTFLGHTKEGQSAIFVTAGNVDCHVILRGGRKTVNYTADAVGQVCQQLKDAGLTPRVMVDCSHANSNKDYTKQAVVCRDVAHQIKDGSRNIFGVMLESNLVAGAQKLVDGRPLVYGQSITDGCMGWDETLGLLRELASAVRSGRNNN